VVVSLVEALEFNLLQIAFARRMAEELCWDVVVRPMWNVGFGPAEQECFPNAISPPRDLLPLAGNVGINDTIWAAINYKPPDLKITDKEWDRNNALVKTWANEKSHSNNNNNNDGEIWTCIHPKCTFSETDVQAALTTIRSKESKTRVVYLENYFLQHEWLADWRPNLRDWLTVKPSCCSATPPPDAVVIHVQSKNSDNRLETFEIQGQEYERLLQKYNLRGNLIWVVCDADDCQNAQYLTENLGGVTVVHPTSPTDAFCILSQAKILVVTPNSILSMVAAAATVMKSNNNKDAAAAASVVHYPTTRTRDDKPKFALALPDYTYHAVANGKFVSWNVQHKVLEFQPSWNYYA
jgi:hypothetical protein